MLTLFEPLLTKLFRLRPFDSTDAFPVLSLTGKAKHVSTAIDYFLMKKNKGMVECLIQKTQPPTYYLLVLASAFARGGLSRHHQLR